MPDASPAPDVSTTPPMRFRRTRIVVSVFFGLLTVALCVSWVRSYSLYDECHFKVPVSERRWWITFSSFDGRLQSKAYNTQIVMPSHRAFASKSRSIPIETWFAKEKRNVAQGMTPRAYTLGFSYRALTSGAEFVQPMWLVVLLSGTLATAPWLRWCFSLRILLIAVTLVAIVLGLGFSLIS